jgi:hypothetical protein
VYGAFPVFVTLVGWFWPKPIDVERRDESFSPGAPEPVVPEAPA